MAEARIVHLSGSLPARLAGTTTIDVWRRTLMDAGLPMAPHDEPPADPDAATFHAILIELHDGLRRLRLVEIERDLHALPQSWAKGEVPMWVWGAMLLTFAALMTLINCAVAIVVSLALYCFASLIGLAFWAIQEARRRRVHREAAAAHAAERGLLVGVVRRVYARPVELVYGDTRYFVLPDAVEEARA